LQVYQDTLGNATAGVGYNVQSRGWDFWDQIAGDHSTITELAALQVLSADISRVEQATTVHWPFYLQLDDVRQRVALDLAFNIGLGALAFKKTIAAVERRDWSTAVRELYKSRWAYQVDDGPGGKYGRADRLGQMLLTGRDYDH